MPAAGAPAKIYLISSGVLAEEKSLISAIRECGAVAVPVLDSELLVGSDNQIPDDEAVVLVRTPSYFRSCVVSSWLESRGHRPLNSFHCLSLFGVKSRTDYWLRKHGMRAIPSMIFLGDSSLVAAGERLGFPLIVKPDIGGFGKRVHLARDHQELRQISEHVLQLAPAHQRYLYVQKYCDVQHDLRVVVLNGEVLAVMERVADQEPLISKNIAQGGRATRYRLGQQESETMAKFCRAAPSGFFGVDLLITRDGDVFVCEVNAVCKFSATARSSGVDIASRLVDAAVTLAGAGGAEHD